MAESIGYKLHRWKSKMSYLSCPLQLHLKCDDSDLKNICICILVLVDTLYLRAFPLQVAVHALTSTSTCKPVTADNLWFLLHYNQRVLLVATSWIIPTTLCCIIIISHILFSSAATTQFPPQGSLKFNLNWTEKSTTWKLFCSYTRLGTNCKLLLQQPILWQI